jgi:magnesium chelatase family protein
MITTLMAVRRNPLAHLPLLPEEAVEVTRLHSLAGQLPPDMGLITTPPFRSPHHSASAEGILGGGKSVRPGEISLAHFGILFLDEAPEFRVNVLQALREPLEDRVISISRAEGPLRLPADFQLVLAANPCPCGKLGMKTPVLKAADVKTTGKGTEMPVMGEPDSPPTGQAWDYGGFSGMGNAACFCSPEEIHRYWRKFGGALLDRVEIRVAVNSAGALLAGKSSEETSEKIAERVRRAQEIQRERFKGTPIRRNSRMTPDLIERHCALTNEAEAAFSAASAKLGFSGRGYHAALRLSRTIADHEGSDVIQTVHILEAVQHRRLGDDPYDIFG